MPETKPTTIRLTDEARANAEAIVRSGAAADISSAIHVALAIVAKRVRPAKGS